MRTILLGPNGQLGFDVQQANARRGALLAIAPIGRAELDLSKIDGAIAYLEKRAFDCLINCSSYHKTDEVERNAQLAFTINAHLVEQLAALCMRKRAKFVHVSTDYVFGGCATNVPLKETDAKAPVNVYGASKAMGEDLALMFGGDILILRVASLFGVSGASGKGGNFVETMIRAGRDKGELRVVADQTMSPTSTADVAEALLDMLARGVPSGIWHVTNTGAATWHEFAARIIARARVQANVIPIKTDEFLLVARRPSYSVLDSGKLASHVKPMRPWQDALDSYLAAKGHL
jgi:dTDP-4-dehydrorhamnose reductase